ncbi:MAG: hypothetical protein M1829_000699 [Trizodia sp. TS-e1964]|nr:MAG: hypothetical protein M1829_000699 [Trizodia sp. TS-e1964]
MLLGRARIRERSFDEVKRPQAPGGRQNSYYPLATSSQASFRQNSRYSDEESEQAIEANLHAYFRWHIWQSPTEKRAFLHAQGVLETEGYNLKAISKLEHSDWVDLGLKSSLGRLVSQGVAEFVDKVRANQVFNSGNVTAEQRGNWMTDYLESQDNGEFANDLLLNPAMRDTDKLTQEVDLPTLPPAPELQSQQAEFGLAQPTYEATMQALTSKIN